MKKSSKQKTRELFFTELRIAGGVPLFVRTGRISRITDALKWCCEKRGLRIYEYVILPDRILMIVNTGWGSLTEVLESFKAFTSKAMALQLRNGSHTLDTSWMLSVFQEHGPAGRPEGIHIWESELMIQSLFTQDQIDRCVSEIHKKPVTTGLVAKPDHYLNCSANPRHPLAGWVVEATDPWS